MQSTPIISDKYSQNIENPILISKIEFNTFLRPFPQPIKVNKIVWLWLCGISYLETTDNLKNLNFKKQKDTCGKRVCMVQ